MTPGNNGYQQGGRGRSGMGAPHGQSRNYEANRPGERSYMDAKKEILPDEFVDLAMDTMAQILKTAPKRDTRDSITTSKIRNLLSMVMDIYNQEYRRSEKELLEESRLKLQMVRVRMIYEAGRDGNVRKFLEQSKLLCYLKGIESDRTRLIRYTQYLEALVAYHRYMGGREN